jgi:hypothetical protein
LMVEKCLAELLFLNKSESDRRKIESYLASKITISKLLEIKTSNSKHPVFGSRFFFNQLAQVTLNSEVQRILSDGNIHVDYDLEKELKELVDLVLGPRYDLVKLFNSDGNSQKIEFTPNQRHFINLKFSAKYFLNRDDKFYLDSIEPYVFSSDNPYDYIMCEALIKRLVDSFLSRLISSFDPCVYLELCDSCLYNGHRLNALYFPDRPHENTLRNLDETSFPPAGFFFALVTDLLDLASLTYSQYMDIIRHFYTSTFLHPRFQKKLYSDLIDPAISSTFGFESLSQDVLSIILSYVNMDIRSARNMLLVSNAFYFGTRNYLVRSDENVFEAYRTSFIGQLLPLFTRVESLQTKGDILSELYNIHSTSIDHALDPLSISNTFDPGRLDDTPFFHQFRDLIYGFYPFAPCISTREYYYLLRPFLLHFLPSVISHAEDPLKPFESAILSNKFSLVHFHEYLDSLLPLMKKANLTASVLGLNENNIRRMLCNFNNWRGIKWTGDGKTLLFDLCLKEISCVLLLLKDPLTSKQFNTIIERVLAEK